MCIALQIQSGWARTHEVNLLASNLIDPDILHGGSGIYTIHDFEAAIPVTKTPLLIVHQIPKISLNTKPLYKVRIYVSLYSSTSSISYLAQVVWFSYCNIAPLHKKSTYKLLN